MAKKGGLGKGLNAIFIENDAEDQNSTVTLKISEIEPNRTQPRHDFDDKALAELADSIIQYGVLQPILVRPIIGGGYQIVAGERRYRASRMAGLTEVPVVIRELSDGETMELALIENLQREDLTPIEEAQGYKTLMSEYGLSQEEVSKRVGKSRSAIANMLRLLTLPDEVVKMVADGSISAGHARALVTLNDEKAQKELAELIVSKGLSVRQIEKLVKSYEKEQKPKTKAESKPTFFSEVELALSENIGKKVKITKAKEGDGGTLHIDFYSLEELKEIANKLEEK